MSRSSGLIEPVVDGIQVVAADACPSVSGTAFTVAPARHFPSSRLWMLPMVMRHIGWLASGTAEPISRPRTPGRD